MSSANQTVESINTGAASDREQLVDGTGNSGDTQHLEVAPLQVDPSAAQRALKQTEEGLRIVIISCISFAVVITVALIITIAVLPPQFPPHGAVASDVKECSDVGVQLLKDGGSAVDAAIGTILCLGVLEPETAGIGGGGVMLVRQHRKNETQLIEFLSSAPTAWNQDSMSSPDSSQIGKTVAVPGLLRGLELAHNKYGKLSWSDVVTPVIALAGNATQQIELAELLQSIADNGADAFYTGNVAHDIVAKVNSAGGTWTRDDLSQYTAELNDPVSCTFLDSTILASSVPTDGPFLLLMLNIMENLTKEGVVTWQSPQLIHYVIEAMKFMYADRDDLLKNLNSTSQSDIDELISKEYASMVAGQINGNHTLSSYLLNPGASSVEPIDAMKQISSSHVSVIGPDEDFVAATVSLNDRSGSQLYVQGFYLNNQLKLPENYELYGSTKRAPVLSGLPVLAFKTSTACGERISGGAGGGYFTAAGLAEVLIKLIGQKKDVGTAVNSSRIYADVATGNMYSDGELAQDMRELLQEKGHEVSTISPAEPVLVNIATKRNELIRGYADSTEGGASVY